MTNRGRTGKTTEHWAVSKEYFENMAARNGWILRDTEPEPKAKILKTKCIFEGDAQFPNHMLKPKGEFQTDPVSRLKTVGNSLDLR